MRKVTRSSRRRVKQKGFDDMLKSAGLIKSRQSFELLKQVLSEQEESSRAEEDLEIVNESYYMQLYRILRVTAKAYAMTAKSTYGISELTNPSAITDMLIEKYGNDRSDHMYEFVERIMHLVRTYEQNVSSVTAQDAFKSTVSQYINFEEFNLLRRLTSLKDIVSDGLILSAQSEMSSSFSDSLGTAITLIEMSDENDLTENIVHAIQTLYTDMWDYLFYSLQFYDRYDSVYTPNGYIPSHWRTIISTVSYLTEFKASYIIPYEISNYDSFTMNSIARSFQSMHNTICCSLIEDYHVVDNELDVVFAQYDYSDDSVAIGSVKGTNSVPEDCLICAIYYNGIDLLTEVKLCGSVADPNKDPQLMYLQEDETNWNDSLKLLNALIIWFGSRIIKNIATDSETYELLKGDFVSIIDMCTQVGAVVKIDPSTRRTNTEETLVHDINLMVEDNFYLELP